MSIISVRALNFKKITEIDLKFDGKSFFVVGDSEEGKTTLLRIILSTLMLQDFPEDPLTTGADEGFIEAVHELDGMKYTIKRTFSKNKDAKTRFTVVDQNGGRHTLSKLLETIFGKAFTNCYFDYNIFFHQLKSTEARTNYLIKTIGGDPVLDNLSLIEKTRLERGKIGTEITKYTNIIEHSTLNPATLEEDIITYQDEKLPQEAIEKKAELLNTRKDISNLQNQFEVVKEGNEAFELSEESLQGINVEMERLKMELQRLEEEKTNTLNWQKNNPPDFDLQHKLVKEISTVAIDNKAIEEQADQLYNELIAEVYQHNSKRAELKTALISYDELQRQNDLWDEKDTEITNLIKENKKIFAEKLPIPGMTIEEVNEKLTVMYEDREFCYENVSDGQAIRLSILIQRTLNPKGNNLVVISRSNLLGSKLDEVLEVCHEYQVQAIVEVTERKQKLQIKFEEDYLN